MYAFVITATCLVLLYKTHINEGRMIGRFRRDTSQPHVEAVYSRYKQQSHGEATYYGKYPGGGACSLDPLSPLASQPGWIRVAVGREDFQNSLGCGMCLEITGSGKGKGSDPVTGTLRGIAHDLCGGCKQGDLDLYIPGDGRWEISFKAIDCPILSGSNGNIMMRFTGSNPWYIKLQARNTRVSVAGIEVLKNGKYSCLKRVNDNYFVGDGLGKVDFPMQVRLTAVNGEQRETIISTMKNDEDAFTDIQFTGHQTGGGPSVIKCMGQGNKPPYPSGGMDPGSTGVSPSQPTTGVIPGPVPAPTQAPPTYPPSPENVNFCKQRKGGTYADPDRCSGFIICNIGNTHRMTCGDGLMFNTKGMNCDLPERVDCGDRPLDSPNVSNHGDGDQVQQNVAHRQMAEDQPIHKKLKERKSNESITLGEGHSGGDTDIREKPPLSNEQDTSTGRHELDNSEADVTPPIQLGVDFEGESKKEDKTNDSTQNDSKHVKTTNPTEPVVHVLINGNKNLTPMSSSSQSDDEAIKSKPSFQIMVNNDGIKASLGGSEEERNKVDHNSWDQLDEKKQKQTFHLVINNNQRKKVNDEVQGNNGVVQERGDEQKNSKTNFELMINNNKDQVIKQDDQRQKEFENQGSNNDHLDQDHSNQVKHLVNESKIKNKELGLNNQHSNEIGRIEKNGKVQHLNAAGKGKEPGLDIELLPMLPLHDQPIPNNASQNTKVMDAKNSNNIISKMPKTLTDGMSKANAQEDINTGKQEMHKNQNSTREIKQEKAITINKNQDNGTNLEDHSDAQESSTLNSSKAENNIMKPSEPLPKTTTNPALLENQQDIRLKFRTPQSRFKHPLEALSYGSVQQQPITSTARVIEDIGKDNKIDGPKEEESSLIIGKKINEQKIEKDGNKPEGSMDNSHVGSLQNLQGQGKVKRPTVDILVDGERGGTTELRMRNSNNEIARLDDASDKSASSNRNPVIGITIKQKGSPDHHILFSKRQRLSNGKHLHRHRRRHRHHHQYHKHH